MKQTKDRFYWIGGFLGVSIVLDQFTKYLAQAHLRGKPAIVYLGDFFRLQYAENPGAMLGFGSQWPEEVRFWVLTVGPAFILLALLGYILFTPDLTRSQNISLSLIAGGGLSNILDRIINDGWVVDFMNMGIAGIRTGIFNIADVAIMAGLGVMLVFGEVFTHHEEGKTESLQPVANANEENEQDNQTMS